MTLPADTVAVLVGIEEYQVGRDWGVDGPALDACRFAQWLTSRGVPADQITLLVSPLPENAQAVAEQSKGYRDGVPDQATVRELFTRDLPSQKSGLFVLYWGGHGVIEQDERRLFYADATLQDKRNLDLSSLLRFMRSDIFAGHLQQLVFVDASLTYATQLRFNTSLPTETFSIGPPGPPQRPTGSTRRERRRDGGKHKRLENGSLLAGRAGCARRSPG